MTENFEETNAFPFTRTITSTSDTKLNLGVRTVTAVIGTDPDGLAIFRETTAAKESPKNTDALEKDCNPLTVITTA